MGRANNNANTEYNVGESGGANNNTDADLDMDRSNKNVDTKHDPSEVNNTSDVNETNNAKRGKSI